jgi:hypothetical protein
MREGGGRKNNRREGESGKSWEKLEMFNCGGCDGEKEHHFVGRFPGSARSPFL